jgi:hypothetical protein
VKKQIPINDGRVADEHYDAFLSYSRHDYDFATRLQELLERRFRRLVPADLRAGRKTLRICRDETDFTSEGDLGSAIRAKLQASSKLLVVCSPTAKESPWVEREIATFRAARNATGNENIIALLHKGDDPVRESAFPQNLLTGGDEPLAVEFRSNRFTSKEYTQYTGTDGALRIIAPLLGVEYPVLKNRHAQYERQRLRRNFAVSTVLAVVFLILSVVAFVQYRRAEQERAAAVASLDEALFGYLGLTADEMRNGNLTGSQEHLEWVARLAAMMPPEGGPVEWLVWNTIADTYWELGEEYRLASNMPSALSAYSVCDRILERLLNVADRNARDARWTKYLSQHRVDFGSTAVPNSITMLTQGGPTVIEDARTRRGEIAATLRRLLHGRTGSVAPAPGKQEESR